MAEFQLRVVAEPEVRDGWIDATSTVLSGCADLGLPVRHACRNGVCGLCKCRLVSGTISYQGREPHGLWQKHIDAGLILPCIAYPRSDLELDGLPLDVMPKTDMTPPDDSVR